MQAQKTPAAVIPQPLSILPNGKEAFAVNEIQNIYYPADRPDIRETGNLLRTWLQKETSNRIALGTEPTNWPSIDMLVDSTIGPPEKYRIHIEKQKITLTAASERGLLAGCQTLRQLVTQVDSMPVIPALDIDDAPAYAWRGAHLDVGRHFMPVQRIKEYLDVMALYKLNVFHWHLTEDQGWRIEIKKYPELTRKGAWRKEADGSRHGGFYTQKQVREIVEYARVRGIEVVPEIEMPGHCLAALSAYPEYSCTGGPFQVPNTWGVFSDVFCAGNDATFTFLEDVLTEILPLFPSPYVHIGGDEVPKTRWHNCPRCQARMQQAGLKDEHELQRYFVQRIETFLQSKGKQLAGWDEILEGGLSPSALVEVWRGNEQAQAAGRNGNRFITTNYFDGSPGNNPLEKVYQFDPMPKDLAAAHRPQCLGAECCMWTEHIPEYKLMPMFLPRVAAFAEAAWNPGFKNYKHFKQRLDKHYDLYKKQEWAYGPEDKHFFLSSIRYDKNAGVWRIQTQTGMPETEVEYVWNDFEKTGRILNDTMSLRNEGLVSIQAMRKGKPFAEKVQYEIAQHYALGKSIELAKPAHEKYGPDRNSGLVDGLIGSSATFNDGVWLGWWGDDLDARIDLGAVVDITTINTGFFHQSLSWVVLPRKVVYSVSEDGKKWTELLRKDLESNPNDPAVFKKNVEYYSNFAVKARYVRVQATGHGVLPEGHNGAGGKAWIFADEILVR